MGTDKRVIGILSSSMGSFFMKRILTGIGKALQGKPYAVKHFEMRGLSDLAYHRFVEAVADEPGMCGLIYAHLRLNVNQVARFKSRNIQVAAVTERMPGIHWVTVDEVKGAYLATRHLLAMGHRKIALLNGPALAIQSRLREDGFLRALAEEGIYFGKDKDLRILNFSEDEGKDAMNMLLDLADPPTAVFCAAGDMAALGAMRALRDRGVDCPGKMSLVGFDNLEFCGSIYPTLTSVNQPLEDMAEWAATRLIASMETRGIKADAEIFEPELVTRESVAELGGSRSQSKV
jgi:DNA-binding LacI/PurR family transcriptional regulator